MRRMDKCSWEIDKSAKCLNKCMERSGEKGSLDAAERHPGKVADDAKGWPQSTFTNN